MITIKELKKKLSTRSRLIGLDLGSKRIGIGICDENHKIATPFKTVIKTNLDDFIKQLKEIIEENNIKGIIVGNPVNMDGSFGKSSQSIKDKSNIIAKKIEIPVALWDERLSTVGSFNLSNKLDVNVTKREKDIDKMLQRSYCKEHWII